MKKEHPRGRREYSKNELAWIYDRHDMKRVDLHRLFVKQFDREDVTLFNLRDLLWRNKWKSAIKRIHYSPSEIRFLERHREMPRRDLHKRFVKKFDRADVTCANIKDECRRRGFLTGRSASPPERPIGWRYIDKDGFYRIKVDCGKGGYRNWALEHRLNWEQQYGPIPKGHGLKCVDGNSLNVCASNWVCVPKGVINRLRRRGFVDAAAELKPAIIAVSKLEHSIALRRKG
jgi:hypothetical protein